ncbi:MAG: T9SS type A sorting domain-containing protein [Ignavibacteriales bacterium]|nr:T9SS type A sorting domain-containing protein [Ignavibacteriales bacterium]
MKNCFLLFFTALFSATSAAQEVRLSTVYNYPLLPGTAQDSVLNGLKSIRGSTYHPDPEGDGKSAIALTNYFTDGRVHVFATAGNDSIELVWTSPRVTSGGGGSTPRYVVFGDLDNDGKIEVIFQSSNNGIFIFEHDGVPGSHNYGTSPSQLISTPLLQAADGFAEYMEVLDVDGDSKNELLVAYRTGSSLTQAYYVFSADGDWSTNDPGFSVIDFEFKKLRSELATWSLGGGSNYAMISAQLDGTGNKEIIMHAFDRMAVSPVRVPSANTYLLADTTNGKAGLRLTSPNDYVALFGGLAFDIDKDGREEVYLPTFVGTDPTGAGAGKIHVISYESGQSPAEIDSSNVWTLDLSGLMGDSRSTFGAGFGDIDGDLKYEIYISTTYPFNVMALEFQGGDKREQANWTSWVLYPGDSTIYTALTIRDSLGVLDTLSRTIDPSFASKIYAKETDFDKDGFEDILLPYQALSDSISVTRYTWNSGSSQFDTTTTNELNPKRWGFRIIEGTLLSGVEVKDLTIIMPDDYRLEQNYPNPFNPSTTIPFSLPVRARISMKIYDVLGKEIRILINNEEYQAGRAEISWDGKGNNGMPVASGTYFYSLIYGNFQKTNKMVLVK